MPDALAQPRFIEDEDLSLEAEVRRVELLPRPKTRRGPATDAKRLRNQRYRKGVRDRTHKVFDQLWLSGFMSRDQAYTWLRWKLGKLDNDEGHIAKLSTSECNRLIRLVREHFPFLLAEDA